MKKAANAWNGRAQVHRTTELALTKLRYTAPHVCRTTYVGLGTGPHGFVMSVVQCCDSRARNSMTLQWVLCSVSLAQCFPKGSKGWMQPVVVDREAEAKGPYR